MCKMARTCMPENRILPETCSLLIQKVMNEDSVSNCYKSSNLEVMLQYLTTNYKNLEFKIDQVADYRPGEKLEKILVVGRQTKGYEHITGPVDTINLKISKKTKRFG